MATPTCHTEQGSTTPNQRWVDYIVNVIDYDYAYFEFYDYDYDYDYSHFESN